MRGQSTFPMDEIDVHLLSDIIEHFLGTDRESAELIRDELKTVQNGHKPSFENKNATRIIDDLSKIVERAPADMLVENVTEYNPKSDVESDFLDLTVKGYVKMRRDYFDEIHNPYR